MFGVNAMMKPVRHRDGIAQPRPPRKRTGLPTSTAAWPDLPLDRHLSVLLWITWLLGCQTAGLRVCHRSDHFRVLQHLCGQHGAAIQKGWSLEGLSFRERMYIVLSLLAKTALAWQIWVGTLRP